MKLLLLLLCPVLLLAACASPPPFTFDEEVEVASTKVLHEVILLSLQDLGFPIGSGGVPGDWRVESLWKEDRHPFQGKGWRKKAIVEYESSSLGRHRLRCRVDVEVNQSHRPLDQDFDEWEEAGQDEVLARGILAKVKAWLRAS